MILWLRNGVLSPLPRLWIKVAAYSATLGYKPNIVLALNLVAFLVRHSVV